NRDDDERDDARVEMNLRGARQRRPSARDDPRNRKARQPESGERSQRREQQAFHEKLLSDTPTARYERSEHGDLARTRRRARKQQARRIRARDEQHEHRGAEERRELLLYLGVENDVAVHR